MRDPQQLERLMAYEQPKRIFILEALKYVEEVIEEHLYNFDGAFARNLVEIKMSDIFYSVFAYEYDDDGYERIAIDWKNSRVEHNCYSAVPEEIYLKSWHELFDKIVQNLNEKSMIADWFLSLKNEIEGQGLHVHELFKYESNVFVVQWSGKRI